MLDCFCDKPRRRDVNRLGQASEGSDVDLRRPVCEQLRKPRGIEVGDAAKSSAVLPEASIDRPKASGKATPSPVNSLRQILTIWVCSLDEPATPRQPLLCLGRRQLEASIVQA